MVATAPVETMLDKSLMGYWWAHAEWKSCCWLHCQASGGLLVRCCAHIGWERGCWRHVEASGDPMVGSSD